MQRALKSSGENGHISVRIAAYRNNITLEKVQVHKQCFLDCLEASEGAASTCVLHAKRFENMVGFTSLQLIALT